jgi:hypothetical protein
LALGFELAPRELVEVLLVLLEVLLSQEGRNAETRCIFGKGTSRQVWSPSLSPS